jgi:hypothetical protein
MERVKDPERFLAELERPLGGTVRKPTRAEQEAEGESFMDFAAAFGVMPPKAVADQQEVAV